MPITKTTHYEYTAGNAVYSNKKMDMYVGRVLKVEHTVETRNWSDTLDYSDHRTTNCTYATVWVGTRGLPPTDARGFRLPLYLEDEAVPEYYTGHVRDLEPHEQFRRVDCTNLFSDRSGRSLGPKEDSFDMQLLWGGPEMLENWKLYEAHLAAEKLKAEAEAAVRQAAREAEEAKAAEKAAKKAAKDNAAKTEAESLLAKFPAKGTTVTVDGFTGKLFWTGATKYRGKWAAKAGIKNARGEVSWVSSDKF